MFELSAAADEVSVEFKIRLTSNIPTLLAFGYFTNV